MSLKHIVKGYTNKALSDVGMLPTEKEEVAQSRLKICSTCPVFDSVARKCVKARGGCGCNMDKKAYCMECSCPINKWKAV